MRTTRKARTSILETNMRGHLASLHTTKLVFPEQRHTEQEPVAPNEWSKASNGNNITNTGSTECISGWKSSVKNKKSTWSDTFNSVQYNPVGYGGLTHRLRTSVCKSQKSKNNFHLASYGSRKKNPTFEIKCHPFHKLFFWHFFNKQQSQECTDVWREESLSTTHIIQARTATRVARGQK